MCTSVTGSLVLSPPLFTFLFQSLLLPLLQALCESDGPTSTHTHTHTTTLTCKLVEGVLEDCGWFEIQLTKGKLTGKWKMTEVTVPTTHLLMATHTHTQYTCNTFNIQYMCKQYWLHTTAIPLSLKSAPSLGQWLRQCPGISPTLHTPVNTHTHTITSTFLSPKDQMI